MAETKTRPTGQSVIDFIDAVPNETRRKDGFHVLEMMKQITGKEPTMWGPSIIGFGFYHYKYESGHEGDAPLLAFSPRKAHLVLYILSDFDGQSADLQKLGKFKTGKVCLYINKLADVDVAVLEQMIVKSWKHAQENPDARC